MATIVVSNTAELTAALKTGGPGSTIELNSGSYTLSLRGRDLGGTVITAADGANAYFSKVNLNAVSHLAFDGVDFRDATGTGKPFVVASSTDVAIRNAEIDGKTVNGYGTGTGLWISQNQGFTLENSHITDFNTAAWLGFDTDLTVRNNTFSNITLDAMIVGRVHDATIADNKIDLHSTPGLRHSDGIQFYNSETNNPSTNVLIEGNVIRTHNDQSHGIYMANALANGGGGEATWFHDVTIRDNIVVAGDGFGIAWGQTDGLAISDNVILRDIVVVPVSVRAGAPHILVHKDAVNVSITGNVMHMAPAPSDPQWQPTGAEPEWVIVGNRIVAIGSTVDDDGTLHILDVPIGNGRSDAFRFDAVGPTDVVSGLNFGEGDRIYLNKYAGNTFVSLADANALEVTLGGKRAVLDHFNDIRELDAGSAAVSVRDAGNDTLAIDIAQGSAIHTVELLGMAHFYF